MTSHSFTNYYKVGGSLSANHPTYITRQADTQLLTLLQQGEFCCVFNSRQTGKSSLRVNTMKKLRKLGYKCASIDLTLIGNKVSQEQWYFSFANQVIYKLEIEDEINIEQWWSQFSPLSEVQKLNDLFSEILSQVIDKNIIIFIDETDSLITLPFKDDFFALIRACYNLRAENKDYHRLTFCFLGVMTPSSLIQDKQRTPFNISRSIELTGFTFEEAKQPLSGGIKEYYNETDAILQEILYWTGGQPFLTQKLCKLFVEKSANESITVKQLVQNYMITNWEYQDEPEHLRTIADRLLGEETKAIKLLGLYQDILTQNPDYQNPAKDIEIQLRLSGLVIKKEGRLQIYNPIYATIFNQDWIQQQLQKLRPYAKIIDQWIRSNYDSKFLLQGKELETALSWAKNRALSDEDYRFLSESQKQVLNHLQKKSKRVIYQGGVIAALLLIVSLVFSQFQLRKVKEITTINEQSYQGERQFESQQIESLIIAMKGANRLQTMVKNPHSIRQYPTFTPIYTLVNILTQIREYNQINLIDTELTTIKINPQGNKIAVGKNEGKIQIYDLKGNYIKTIQGHQGNIKQIFFNQEGNQITVMDETGTISLWNINTGKAIKKINPDRIYTIKQMIQAQNDLLTLESNNNKITLKKADGSLVTTFTLENNQREPYFYLNPLKKVIMIGTEQGEVNILGMDGKLQKKIKAHQQPITTIAVSRDHQILATGSEDRVIKLWTPEGKLIRRLEGHSDAISHLIFSPNNQLIASISQDKTIKLWQIDGKLITTLAGHQEDIMSLEFTPDNQTIISASREGKIKFWKLTAGKIQRLIHPRKAVTFWNNIDNLPNYIDYPQDIPFEPAISQTANKIILPVEGGIQIQNFEGKVIKGLDITPNFITSVDISKEGKLMVIGTDNREVMIIDYNDNITQTDTQHSHWVTDVTISPNHDLIASGDKTGIIKLWTKDGQLITTLADKTQQDNKSHVGQINDLSFTLDGQILISASDDQTVKLWKKDGTLINTLSGHSQGVNSVDFIENGAIIVSGSQDGTVKLWNQKGILLTTLSVKNQPIDLVKFNANGTQLMVKTQQGEVFIWNISLNKLIPQGCQWLKDYLTVNEHEIKSLCNEYYHNHNDL